MQQQQQHEHTLVRNKYDNNELGKLSVVTAAESSPTAYSCVRTQLIIGTTLTAATTIQYVATSPRTERGKNLYTQLPQSVSQNPYQR